jgi:ATP-dependent Lhr-like helicase
MDSDDTLEALVIGRKTYEEELEPVVIPEKPYDVLTHQIAGLLTKNSRLSFDEIYETIKKAYPYRNLENEEFNQVIEYMNSRFPRLLWASFENKAIFKPRYKKPLFEYYFNHLSMIPDQKHYLVVNNQTDLAIGLLDESFVAEYGKPGVKFIIRGSPWKILNVFSDKIYVESVEDPAGAIPSWIGEEIPVPFEVAQEVGNLRGGVEESLKNGETPHSIAEILSKKYPSDEKTILAAISPTLRSVEEGHTVPTDKLITIEDWEDFVILNACFGSLTNRAFAQLLGHLISDKIGYSIIVQHDPYRIFIKTMGEIKAETVRRIIDELKNSSLKIIEKTLLRGSVKTGIFKRRLIHVASRFGAIKKGADLRNLNLQSLVKSFEDTVIYKEALREIFTKDIDLDNLIKVFQKIKKDKIKMVTINNKGKPTPITRVGIKKASMKSDLIPPEKMKRILVELTKARLLDETNTFLCTNCWDFLEMIKIKELPENFECPKCRSTNIGLLRVEDKNVFSLIDKKGKKLTFSEQKLKNKALETSKLISKYGKKAAIALSGRRLIINDLKKILSKKGIISDEFFELIIEAERNALKRRFM